MYEPASLGMFQCRLQRILCDFEVIMFFRKDPPQTEGRRHAHPLIKTGPDSVVLDPGEMKNTQLHTRTGPLSSQDKSHFCAKSATVQPFLSPQTRWYVNIPGSTSTPLRDAGSDEGMFIRTRL